MNLLTNLCLMLPFGVNSDQAKEAWNENCNPTTKHPKKGKTKIELTNGGLNRWTGY